jgi:hypothetical protein
VDDERDRDLTREPPEPPEEKRELERPDDTREDVTVREPRRSPPDDDGEAA